MQVHIAQVYNFIIPVSITLIKVTINLQVYTFFAT